MLQPVSVCMLKRVDSSVHWRGVECPEMNTSSAAPLLAAKDLCQVQRLLLQLGHCRISETQVTDSVGNTESGIVCEYISRTS